MTDLANGIIDVNGFELTRYTQLREFENLPKGVVNIQKSKRGNTYIKFLDPLHSNGVDVIVEVSFFSDSPDPEIKLFPKVPSELKGDYIAISQYKLSSAKQWLAGVIKTPPDTSNSSCVFYRFGFVEYFSSVSRDLHYGMSGGEICVTFHEV